MVNLHICAKCLLGKYDPSRTGEDGVLIEAPSVNCELETGFLLLFDSELPVGCPFVLEHKLTEDEAFSCAESVRNEFYGTEDDDGNV